MKMAESIVGHIQLIKLPFRLQKVKGQIKRFFFNWIFIKCNNVYVAMCTEHLCVFSGFRKRRSPRNSKYSGGHTSISLAHQHKMLWNRCCALYFIGEDSAIWGDSTGCSGCHCVLWQLQGGHSYWVLWSKLRVEILGQDSIISRSMSSGKWAQSNLVVCMSIVVVVRYFRMNRFFLDIQVVWTG